MCTLLAFAVLLSLLNVLEAAQLQPHIWPLPQQYTISNELALNVNASSFTFTQTQPTKSEIITNAFTRYTKLCFAHIPEGFGDSSQNTVTGLNVTIMDASENTLGYGMDESYNISIDSYGTATLNANTVWGALRGLETFSQIIVFNSTLNYYQTYSASIYDFARFSHRSVLIDSSRHFLSVNAIQNVLDSMAYSKFNVLHWHITDTESFPYESLTEPALWNASYSMYERYTQNDVRGIISYAKNRGIRVIPEFDMPGHAQSWCVGYPEICPSPTCKTPLNPATNATWQLLTNFIAEAAKLFPDEYMHLGGDEVNTKCWNETQSIVDWMNAMNFTAHDAEIYFYRHAIDIAVNNEKFVIEWDNNQYSSLNATTTIMQIYKGGIHSMPQITKLGFRVIFSPYPMWYLDALNQTWIQRYMVEPQQYVTDPNLQKLVIGGEACMWGEDVDVSDIQQTIWPTAAAVAERLWSSRDVNSTTAAKPRIEFFRCLLNERGIAAAPTNNANDRSAPPNPGSCYSQRR